MKVTQEKLPASQIGLEIEITAEMSKQAYEKTLQEFTRSANIPGFRKGKVPSQVVIQRFGSGRIKATVVEELVQNSLKQALEQEKIEAIGNFELRLPFEELVSQFQPGSTFTFSAAVDVSPEVNLSQYQGFNVQAEEVKHDPAQVEEALENYRRQSATLVPVEGRPAQAGDLAVVDFSGRLMNSDGTEGDEIQGGSATDFEIELAEGRFIEGFIDGIIGMTPGETKNVSVTFPEDYMQKELAGKPTLFSITLKDLKERELPELDDDLAQEISQFETVAALQEFLESRFQEEAAIKTRANKEQALLAALINYLEVELPETLIRQEQEVLVNQMVVQLTNQGIDVQKVLTAELVEQLKAQSRPEAILQLRRRLALSEVAKRESIRVEPTVLEAKITEFLQNYTGEQINTQRVRQVLEENLLKEKTFDWLEQHCTVELVPEGTLKTLEDADVAESTIGVEAVVEPVGLLPDVAELTIDVEAVAEVVGSSIDAADAAIAVEPAVEDSTEPSSSKVVAPATTESADESAELVDGEVAIAPDGTDADNNADELLDKTSSESTSNRSKDDSDAEPSAEPASDPAAEI